ncbi:MAG: hypothetical protein ACON4G_04545 [Candidatus Puniceispirillaceae bacterium]
MADIIDEINEELKQERMQALFAKYGKIIMGIAGAVVAIVVVIQGYGIYQDSVREKAASAYFNALGQEEIGAALSEAKGDLAGGYDMLARFVTAAEMVAKENKQDAYPIYVALSEDSALNIVYRQFAAMQAVINAPEAVAIEELEALISPIAEAAGANQGLALELMANLALEKGDIAGSKAFLEKINSLQDAPNGLRQRAISLSTVLDAQS